MTALLIVRQMDTTATRGAVFQEIVEKNPLYRAISTIYEKLGERLFQPMVLLLYMLKSILSIGRFDTSQEAVVSISNFRNERHTIDRVAALIPDEPILHLTAKRRHLLGPRQLTATLRILGSTPRFWRFLTRIARTHDFMPAARLVSTLAFYARFSQLFEERPHLRVALVASNYAPDALGLAAAAHQSDRQVIYANHAPVPANGSYVPPVLADLALFYGPVTLRTYEQRSRCTAEVAYLGQPSASREMQFASKIKTIGIFLTAGTKPQVLSQLIASIHRSHPATRILIRNHPVALLQTKLTDLDVAAGLVECTIGQPLDDEIAACDVIICGNSGVALNALSAGKPVAYFAELDSLIFDANGFVQNGLLFPVRVWNDDVIPMLYDFYDNQDWRHTMKEYDAGYCAGRSSLETKAAQAIAMTFNTTS